MESIGQKIHNTSGGRLQTYWTTQASQFSAIWIYREPRPQWPNAEGPDVRPCKAIVDRVISTRTWMVAT